VYAGPAPITVIAMPFERARIREE